MLMPYGVDNPMGRLPVMNWVIIGVNVAVFVIQATHGIDFEVYGSVPSDLRWYQPLTSAFLHVGVLHLAANMLFLWTFGNNVNDRLGHWRYLAAYLAFAVLSDLGHALMASGWMADVPCVGASGAVFGVVGTYLAFFPINDVKVAYFFWIFVIVRTGTFSCSAYWIIGLYVAWDAYDALTGSGGATAVMAHLTGFAVGLAAGMTLLWKGWVERDEYDLLARLARRRGRTVSGRMAIESPDPETDKAAAARRMKDWLHTQIQAGEMEAAAETYQALRQAFPNEKLEEHAHIALANWLCHARHLPEAAAAFEHFALMHPGHDQAGHALFSAGTLRAQHLGQPARGRDLLRAAAAKLRDPEKARRARQAAEALGGPPLRGSGT